MSFKEYLLAFIVIATVGGFKYLDYLEEDLYSDAQNYVKQKNYVKALNIFKELAESGDEIAQHNIGLFYFNGLGVEKDTAKSIYWFELAAHSNHSPSQYNLGKIYSATSFLNYEKSFYWYSLAAESGDGEALNNIGVMYSNGLGVEKDLNKALTFFLKAKGLSSQEADNNISAVKEKMLN